MKAYAIALALIITASISLNSWSVNQAESRLATQAASMTESKYEMDISELCSLNQESTANDCKVVGL